jgi:putative colanic acid biosysnthesis UDP-glucose lipid carrier transferase
MNLSTKEQAGLKFVWRNTRNCGLRHVYQRGQATYIIFKRLMDIITSLLIVLILFPMLVPIIALLIKLDSKGPIFFLQERIGYLGKTFWCYKFRTMYLHKGSSSQRASNGDPRITTVGRILRNTCLDEIPQFINVLFGQMSIAGPRPHMPKDTEEFAGVISNYNFRNHLRPGITGLSQVKGFRGPANSFESIYLRYHWDMYYIENISFAMDLKIMWQTALLMLKAITYRNKPVFIDEHLSQKTNSNKHYLL